MNTISSAIAALQAKWHALHNYDRALAILPIIRAGVSRRYLATVLNGSEATIRNLLLILTADAADLECYVRGDISQNELIRRVRGIRSISGGRVRVAQPAVPEQRRRPVMKPPIGWKPIPYFCPPPRPAWSER